MGKEKKKSAPDLVFDDDTSDSDEDLDVFRKNMKDVSSQYADKEQPSSDVDNENDDESLDSEEISDDSESENEAETETPSNSIINDKLGKLSSMLNDGDNESNNDDESSDDNSNDDEQESDDESDNEHQNEQQESGEDESDNSDQENDSKGKYVKINNKPEKRKLDESESEGENKKLKPINEAEEREKYRNKLSRLSVEEILKIKESLGDKIFNSKWSGDGAKTKHKQRPEFKRENKNRPREMSSKIRVPKLVKVVPVTKEAKRDPRFDPLCGEFDKSEFRKQYAFLNKVKEKELSTLKNQLKDAKSNGDRNKLKYLIQRTENQLRNEKQRKDKEKKAADERKEIRDKLSKGEKPVFKSKKEKREQELVDTYERLKKSGRVDKYIEKKSKRNTAKDRQMLEKNQSYANDSD